MKAGRKNAERLEVREAKVEESWDHRVDDSQEVVGKKRVIQANELAQKAVTQKKNVGKFERSEKQDLKVKEMELSAARARAEGEARRAIKVKMRKEQESSKEAVEKETQKYKVS